MPYRNSPHKEVEILTSFDYLPLFGPDGKEDNGNFLVEIKHKKYIHVGKKVISFETDDEIEGYTVQHGFNDV